MEKMSVSQKTPCCSLRFQANMSQVYHFSANTCHLFKFSLRLSFRMLITSSWAKGSKPRRGIPKATSQCRPASSQNLCLKFQFACALSADIHYILQYMYYIYIYYIIQLVSPATLISTPCDNHGRKAVKKQRIRL